MKKLLSILAAFGLSTTLATSVVACTTPTRSPDNVHLLAGIINQAVNKALEDNPLEKPEDKPFDTTSIKEAIVENITKEKDELEKNGVYLKAGLIEESDEAKNALVSVTAFDKLTSEEKTAHEKYLTEQKLKTDDILIYLESIVINASLDNPERITVKIPRMVVRTNEGKPFLLNDGGTLTQLGVIKIKA